MSAFLTEARMAFHQRLVMDRTLMIDHNGVASNADGAQQTSRQIALGIASELNAIRGGGKLPGQQVGKQFEMAVNDFLESTFPQFSTIRPGVWKIQNVGGSRAEYHLSKFEPYSHLATLATAIEESPTLASVLGNNYQISPDVFVVRVPVPDDVINRDRCLVDDISGLSSIVREHNQPRSIVHAVVSCKWTLRTDRAQNARAEALNIIRNRKGRTPHIVVVTGEPSPSRLASLALGTGDIDMVYHFALPELVRAVSSSCNDEAISMLSNLVDGNRLRDIADLPLDLCV